MLATVGLTEAQAEGAGFGASGKARARAFEAGDIG